MSDPDMPTDEKYTVFKTQEFHQLLDIISHMVPVGREVERYRLKDAVVIRRQDFFATQALAVYAGTIALVAQREADPKVKAELLDIADYFQRQSELAAEEGWKLPDL